MALVGGWLKEEEGEVGAGGGIYVGQQAGQRDLGAKSQQNRASECGRKTGSKAASISSDFARAFLPAEHPTSLGRATRKLRSGG